MCEVELDIVCDSLGFAQISWKLAIWPRYPGAIARSVCQGVYSNYIGIGGGAAEISKNGMFSNQKYTYE